jgi:hypothetical protein
MTRFISPRRRWAETVCGLSVTVQRCTYDEIFKIRTCTQCSHAFKLEQAGLPVPEHPIEALKRPETAARLVAENRYPRHEGDKMPAFEISQFFHKKVAQAVEYLEKVGGVIEDPKSAATKLGRDSGIGEHIAGAVVGHLLGMNMVEVERTAKPRSHDIVTRIALKPEAEWLDEKPDYVKVLLDTLADSGGIGDLKSGKAVRMLTEVAGVPFGVAHVRHLLADLEAEGRVHREIMGRRTLWVGLPDQEIPEDIVAKMDEWRAKKAAGEITEPDGDAEDETPPNPVITAEREPTAGDLARNVLGHKLGPWHQEHRLTKERCQEAIDAYIQAGSYKQAGPVLGVSEKSVRQRVKVGLERFGLTLPEGFEPNKPGQHPPRPATPEEVAAITPEAIRQVNVPDAAPVEEDLDYDQLADAMLNKVGRYLADRDDELDGLHRQVADFEAQVAELRQAAIGAGSRAEIDELAQLLNQSSAANGQLKDELTQAQHENQRLRATIASLEANLEGLTKRLREAEAKPKSAAAVSDEAKRSVMGVAKDFLRGPKSP